MCKPLKLNCKYEDSEGYCSLPFGEELCPDLDAQTDKLKEVLEEYHSRGIPEKRKGRIITIDDIRKGRI
jgi:hypothetical protein